MKKVLLVYGQETPAHAHSRSLYYRGVYPMVSHNLKDAYDLSCYGKYDLIVLDLEDNENELMEAITLFSQSEAKVIALLKDYSEEKANLLRNYGCDEVIAKPMHAKEFGNHVADNLQLGDESRFSGEFAWGY